MCYHRRCSMKGCWFIWQNALSMVSLYGTQGVIAPLQRLLNAAAEDYRDLEMRARERQGGILEEAWPQKLRRRTT